MPTASALPEPNCTIRLRGRLLPATSYPPLLITSQATTVLSGFVPLPNAPSTSPGLPNEAANYVGSVSEPIDFDSYTARVDYTFSPKDTLFAVYSHNTGIPLGLSTGHAFHVWQRVGFRLL